MCPAGKKRSPGISDIVVVVQSLSHVQLSVIPWTVAHWVPLSFSTSWSLLKFISIEPVALSKLSSSVILLLLPSVFPSIRVFSSESTLRIGWPTIGASASAVVLSMNIQG